ncbi:tRNA glutamyl-Q(34) synthetase GluQRS [Thalassotalea aquiviva]|uniref:tRNA glutamyl-Q(34) synthetase GluQRS n=1 Tax=Thalassotalea aquiviva TaxID=3242415 RepID=UPI00352BA9E7
MDSPPYNCLPQRSDTCYRGRFAPSPSGFLHFGSLLAALASFLDAKHHQGQWLVRIEDIDPPREQPGAADAILQTLDAYGLHWDEDVLYQSNQNDYYETLLAEIASHQHSYHCRCTRADIKKIGGIYQGHCKSLKHPRAGSAIRLVNQAPIFHFNDRLQGLVEVDVNLAKEDFIIHRKDGLFAYQLAVVADDIAQGINHIVRGCDLLEPTARQLTLYRLFKQTAPSYLHIPLAITAEGRKLSKQNFAPAINNANPQPALWQALHFLGQQPPEELKYLSVAHIIDWGISHWDPNKLPKQREIVFLENQ